MSDGLTTMYIFKGEKYEDPPINSYHVDSIEVVGDMKYIGIRRKLPIYIHVIILCTLLLPLIILNYNSLTKDSVQVRKHTLRVPSEMYYDASTKVLDIDITNDGSNFETVSFSIEDSSGNTIVKLNGINPGESIGSIPVEYNFKKLPLKCKIIYRTTYEGSIFKDIVMDVLVVDRVVADKDVNRDF